MSQFAVFSQRNIKHINTVCGRTHSCWMLNCWCITWTVGVKRLNNFPVSPAAILHVLILKFIPESAIVTADFFKIYFRCFMSKWSSHSTGMSLVLRHNLNVLVFIGELKLEHFGMSVTKRIVMRNYDSCKEIGVSLRVYVGLWVGV
jgi:hypothetical protein